MQNKILRKSFWQLVITKVSMNLKSEAAKSQLNYLWWILEPALFITVYYVVFGIFLNSRTENFIAFLICGKIPFLWFSRTVSNASNSLMAGAGLMNQINISKLFFPLTVIGQDLVKSFAVFLVMILAIWGMGISPSINWLAIIPLMFIQLIFVSALAIFFCALVPFFPDLKFIVSTFIILMMFSSGIFYDPSQFLLPEHRDIFFLNPLAKLIDMYRLVILDNQIPAWSSMLLVGSLSTALLIMSTVFIHVHDAKYPRLVLR